MTTALGPVLIWAIPLTIYLFTHPQYLTTQKFYEGKHKCPTLVSSPTTGFLRQNSRSLTWLFEDTMLSIQMVWILLTALLRRVIESVRISTALSASLAVLSQSVIRQLDVTRQSQLQPSENPGTKTPYNDLITCLDAPLPDGRI